MPDEEHTLADYVTTETYERHHTEAKADHDRLVRMEGRMESAEARLRDGTGTFEDLRAAIELLKPKPISGLKIAGFVLGPVLVLALSAVGVIVKATRLEDRMDTVLTHQAEQAVTIQHLQSAIDMITRHP